MDNNCRAFYSRLLRILESVQLAVDDKAKFVILRKKILDLANDILRMGDCDG